MEYEMDYERHRLNIARFATDRDWGPFHTPKNLAMSIAIESAELMELFQWTEEPESMRAVEEEVADVFIYLIRLADVLDINVDAAIDRKMEMNARKYPAPTIVTTTEIYAHMSPDHRPDVEVLK